MVRGITKKRSEETKTDMAYLYQAPNSESLPCTSPQALAIATYFKMNGIEYETVFHENLLPDHIDQLPMIKYNGQEIVFSNRILSVIANLFQKSDVNLAEIDNGSALAFQVLIEEGLFWVLNYLRTSKNNQLPINDVVQGRWPQFLRPFAAKIYANKLKTKTDYQGIGRQSFEDVLTSAKDDLRAISAYLGEKNYFGGENPNKLDATAFGHLSQFFYASNENELKTFLDENCTNLVSYLDRIKTTYWPDWQEKCRKPTPPKSRSSKSDKEPAPTEEKDQQQQGEVEKTETAAADTEPATNGNTEKKGIIETKESTTVEIVKIEEKPTVGVENGLADEQKHIATTPNGGSAADKITAE